MGELESLLDSQVPLISCMDGDENQCIWGNHNSLIHDRLIYGYSGSYIGGSG